MITLDDAKRHLRVNHSEDDTYITALINAAVGHVQSFLGEDTPEELPAPLDAAVLLLIGNLYEHRESVSDVQLYDNVTFKMLLNPYITQEVL